MKKKRELYLLIAVMLAAMICGCADKKKSSEAFDITMMTSASAGNSVTPDSPVKAKVEELTGTRLNISFVPAEAYSEKLNMVLASGNMPMILYIDKNSPNVMNSIRRGDFWDITDYIGEYEHLSKADEEVIKDLSVDGRMYGLYRARNKGRYGYVYRKDWLDNLGLKEPETIDDFYNMLHAFTYDDPDGNGVDDTYGMIVTNSDITFKNFAVWNGAPNGWGFDKNGRLIPAELTEEYFETVKLFKKMAEDKVINEDYLIMDPENWNIPFVEGKGGVILDTCDRAAPLDRGLKKNNPMGRVGVAGVINNRVRPYLGHSGYFAFPKSSIKDEETLKKVLKFMDDCCDGEVFDLMRYGIEGRHYDIIEGSIRQKTDSDVPRNEINDFNQCLTYIDESEGGRVVSTAIQKQVEAVQNNNINYSIVNPASGLTSSLYEKKSDELDKILTDARIKYIIGMLDDEGYQKELERWRVSGGNDVIREINEAYEKQRNDGSE